MPSPFRSPTATHSGPVPALKLVAAPNEPVPAPSSTETLPPALAVARSCLPSPSKSPVATERGPVPTLKGLPLAAANEPAPSPSSTETLFELLLAVARSRLPSPLKSPVATEREPPPALKGLPLAAANEPVPVPSNTETLPEL